MYLVVDMPHEVEVQMFCEKHLLKQALLHDDYLSFQREGRRDEIAAITVL